MNKKTIILGAALILALIPVMLFAGGGRESGSGQAAAARTVKLTLGTAYAPNHPASIAIEAAKKEIEEKSGGTIILEHYPASQIGDNPELAEGIESGSVDMNVQSISFFTAKVPDALIDGFFFVYQDNDHLYKMWDSDVGKSLKDKIIAAYGVRILDPWIYGSRVMTTKRTPINTPADLRGLKMRVPNNEVWLEMMAAFGATPTPVNLSELYMALSQNVVDGQENPIPTIISQKFQEVQGYISLTDHKIEAIEVMINEKKWQSMSADQQNIVSTAFKNAREINNAEIDKQTVEGLEIFKKAGGMVVENPDKQAFADIIGNFLKTSSKYSSLTDIFNRIQAVK